jgi:hypothetical protein
MSDTIGAPRAVRGLLPAQPQSATRTVDVARLVALLWCGTMVVLSLGVAREAVLSIVGTETILRDLRHFALDAERSVSTWFESLLMALNALLVAVLASLSRSADSENIWHWRVLALIFVLMSMDEVVAFHESTMAPLRAAFGFSGFLHFSWVVIAAPLLAIAASVYLPFLLRLPQPFRWRLLAAGMIFVLGAFGLEIIGGYFASAMGMDSMPYKAEATIEESLEMIGLTLCASSLLALIASRAPALAFSFTLRPRA